MSKPRIAGEGKGKLAFLFPGGDAWAVGMGHDLIRHFAAARAVYKEADEATTRLTLEILGYNQKGELVTVSTGSGLVT